MHAELWRRRDMHAGGGWAGGREAGRVRMWRRGGGERGGEGGTFQKQKSARSRKSMNNGNSGKDEKTRKKKKI